MDKKVTGSVRLFQPGLERRNMGGSEAPDYDGRWENVSIAILGYWKGGKEVGS